MANVVLSVSVFFKESGKITKTVCSNVLKEYTKDSEWNAVLKSVVSRNSSESDSETGETINYDPNNCEVCVFVRKGEDVFHPDIKQTIETSLKFNSAFKYVNFYLSRRNTRPSEDDVSASNPQQNAFQMLMGQGAEPIKIPRRVAENNNRFTDKHRLFNDVCDNFENDGLLFTRSSQDHVHQISNIVNCLWYIDGSKEKFVDRSVHGSVKKLPERFLVNFNNYNDWKKKKQKAPRLESVCLQNYADSIINMLSLSFTSSWPMNLRSDLELFALSLNSYAVYLKKKLIEISSNHKSTKPLREISTHVWLSHHAPIGDDVVLEEMYENLDETLSNLDVYQHLYFEEMTHVNRPFKNRMERLRFLDKLSLSVPVDMLRYDPGGAIGQTIFLWKTPAERNQTEIMTASARMVKSLEGKLPEFHTRRMRSEFQKRFNNISGNRIPQHILRGIYADLTLDSTADQNPGLNSRVQHALLSEDINIITDMRHINLGRPGDTFDVFFQRLSQIIEEQTAADERRHGIEHMAKYISVRDLKNDVSKSCPPGTPIPSESTILFAFVPQNAYTKVAKLYKSKVNLKFKIQTRQLRASHQDEHYAAAQFKYMRHYAIKYLPYTTFLCLDDKSKLDFGEPGSVLSSGVRGKMSLVPTVSHLSALDHDVSSKGSLTPSVCLDVDIPDNNTGSFYRGEVTVTLKDSIFQASNPFRHATELITLLRNKAKVSPALMLYSDGGPDHRLTYSSVKLSLIAIFIELDLDILIAGRTAPGHSWANVAERIMSVLNIAYQNCALSREECSSDIEQVLKSCNSMEDIRKKALTNPIIETEWNKSLQSMINVLCNRTSRLDLKDRPFRCGIPATAETIDILENKIIAHIDPGIEKGKYQKVHMDKAVGYRSYIERHCRERNYTFQIRKCDNIDCCTPSRSSVIFPWVPDPENDPNNIGHYKTFDASVGTDTSEKDRPSNQNVSVSSVAEDQQGCRNSMLTAQNVRHVINCFECNKPRCIYSKTKLTLRETRALKRTMEKYDYSCGSVITPDGSPLHGTIFVRLQLACNSPIEFPYYSSSVGATDVCCFCASSGSSRDKELLKSYKVVLPVCQDCANLGKTAPKRQPKK